MRMRTAVSGACLAILLALPHAGCTGDDPTIGGTPTPGGPEGGSPVDADVSDGDVPLVPASKVDILFVVDNSASMGDKAALLAGSVGTLLRSLAHVGDLHVGVLASSLGSMGGDVCPDQGDYNTFAHLRPSATAGNGVLTYSGGDVEGLVKETESLVRGVGESGCGLEAQLESAYRFLVQPDPWKKVTLDANNQADLGTDADVDEVVLAQRRAFLRPDSAVVVVILTDEDDSSADPLSVSGQGWAFMARSFPGSKVYRGDPRNGTTAPRGTTACTDPAKGPGHPDCTSCGFAALCNAADPACVALKNDANCQKLGAPIPGGDTADGYAGYYGPTEDNLNVRFHRMKERYGIDPQYPIARYVAGFTDAKVPKRATEHVSKIAGGRRDIAPYTQSPTCTNPLFAAELPADANAERCDLPRGPRSRSLVLFTLLGGVPESLTANAPNWSAILGSNPDAYDYTGIDPHMIPSITPRATLPPPSTTRGDNGADPIHGREWDTVNDDLQYACTFPLPATRNCTAQTASCDCALAEKNPPVCGANLGEQIKAKAYPSTRLLRVAHGLGTRGIVGSICAANGYDATMQTLATRIEPLLAQ